MGVAVGVVIGVGLLATLGLITADVTTLASLNAGTPGTELGQVIEWNGTGYQLDRAPNPLFAEGWTEEFDGGSTTFYATNCSVAGHFTGAATGTSACGYNNADTIRRSTVSLTTSTGATDGIRMSTQANSVVFGTVPRCVTWLWKIHNLSDANTQYVDRVGYAEPTANTDSVDAVEAVYDFATSGVNKWAFVTSSNSVKTNTACTGSTGDITADTWYKLKICVNAAGTSATLTINDQLCATNTTNIPTGTSRGTAVGLQHFNATGAVPIAQLSFADLAWEVIPFQVAR